MGRLLSRQAALTETLSGQGEGRSNAYAYHNAPLGGPNCGTALLVEECTLREEGERGIPLTAETGSKLEGGLGIWRSTQG
jgi:hypothetical protein